VLISGLKPCTFSAEIAKQLLEVAHFRQTRSRVLRILIFPSGLNLVTTVVSSAPNFAFSRIQ